MIPLLYTITVLRWSAIYTYVPVLGIYMKQLADLHEIAVVSFYG
jgi:hypothetical protein